MPRPIQRCWRVKRFMRWMPLFLLWISLGGPGFVGHSRSEWPTTPANALTDRHRHGLKGPPGHRLHDRGDALAHYGVGVLEAGDQGEAVAEQRHRQGLDVLGRDEVPADHHGPGLERRQG